MNPQIEEVSDSDSDPSEQDLDTFTDLIAPSSTAGVLPIRSSPSASTAAPPAGPAPPNPKSPEYQAQVQRAQAKIKTWQCLYPVYFDAGRSRAQGRRVGRAQAVANPLASELAAAAQAQGLDAILEPGKTHPKDWANPGRARVQLKEGAGEVRNKAHLYRRVAAWLQAHPTDARTPFQLRIPGVPVPKEAVAPAVPRGWTMGSVLPLHSPAVSGGGVSENMLKDMMAEMQEQGGGAGLPEGMPPGLLGAMGGGGAGESGAGEKKKKEKKKKGKG